jgi:DNA-binding NtrC family response regulator
MEPVRAIVISQDAEAGQFVAMALHHEGAQVALAGDASQALDLLGQRPEVMFADLELPELGDVVRRALLADPHLAIVGLARKETYEVAVRAMRLGVCDCVDRPLTAHKIVAALWHALERRRVLGSVAAAPPSSIGQSPGGDWIAVPLGGGIQQMQRYVIDAVMRRLHGNKAAAARLLGIHRRTLYRLLERDRPADG